MKLVPPNIANRMSEADRKAHGIRTPEENRQRGERKKEKELHREIFALLRRNEIPYVHAPMFRKSELPPGWPDFTFAYQGRPIAWECKVGGSEPTEEQAQMIAKLRACGWAVSVIRSLAEAQWSLFGMEADG